MLFKLQEKVHVPMSQENLSPGNCVVATVLPEEIIINIATEYPKPKENLSPGNTVARMLCRSLVHVFRGDMDQTASC